MQELHCTLFAGAGLNSGLKSFPFIGKDEKQINLSSSTKRSVADLVDNVFLVALEWESTLAILKLLDNMQISSCSSL